MNQTEVIVVIPIYRPMNSFERVSLQQCLRILGHYPIVLVAPESIQSSSFMKLHSFRIERFSDVYFESKKNYSKLLLSQEFYARFSKFTYLLIYQLDAFVFSDKLLDFCRKGYDYIGGPVPRSAWTDATNRVGNGGLSLRRISSCQRVLRTFPPEVFFARHDYCDNPEDSYFAGCAEIDDLDFHVPTIREALNFSVVYDLFHCYRKMPEWMPFGCHAWNAFDYYCFWKPFIESYGYILPGIKGYVAEPMHKHFVDRYILERIPRTVGMHRQAVSTVLTGFVPRTAESIILGGWGEYGNRVWAILQSLGRKVSMIIDRAFTSEDNHRGSIMMAPDFARIQGKGVFVIVTTTKYEDEICAGMIMHGKKEGKDYGRISVLMDLLTQAYLRSFA